MFSVCRLNLFREYFVIFFGLVLVWIYEDYGLVWFLVYSGKGFLYCLYEFKFCVVWVCFVMVYDI